MRIGARSTFSSFIAILTNILCGLRYFQVVYAKLDTKNQRIVLSKYRNCRIELYHVQSNDRAHFHRPIIIHFPHYDIQYSLSTAAFHFPIIHPLARAGRGGSPREIQSTVSPIVSVEITRRSIRGGGMRLCNRTVADLGDLRAA